MTDRQDETSQGFEVVVIGAGPGGSATATRLAQAGRSVLVLERSSFPRFHIGESMLPCSGAVFEQLGILDRIQSSGFMVKEGAEFSGTTGRTVGRITFDKQGPGRFPTTFQVERSRFDEMLANFAEENGAVVRYEANVREILQEDGRVVGVRYEQDGTSHVVRADYVIDAGGRGSRLANLFKTRRYTNRLRNAAVFRHYEGVDEATNPGFEGDIQISGHKDGWVWAIPLSREKLSVGTVMPRDLLRAGDAETLFNEHVSLIKRIAVRIADAKPMGDLQVETDYTYCSDTVTGPGWFMVGDAACFVDPIFSAGVLLAMTTGIRAADTVHRLIAGEGGTEEQLQKGYSDFLKTGYDMYTRLMYAYYESGNNLKPWLASMDLNLSGSELATSHWLVRALSGDFWSQDNQINELLLKEERWDTFGPFDRVWGCPYYGPEAAGSLRTTSAS